MKGVPIKFRGDRIDGNGFAYGDLEHRYNGREIWIGGWQVKPSSVAQLVGYDAAGNEIYEGDRLDAYKTFGISHNVSELVKREPCGTWIASLKMSGALEITTEYCKYLLEDEDIDDYQFLKGDE